MAWRLPLRGRRRDALTPPQGQGSHLAFIEDELRRCTGVEMHPAQPEAEPSVPVRRSSEGGPANVLRRGGAYAHFRSLGGAYVHILKSIDENCAFVDRH